MYTYTYIGHDSNNGLPQSPSSSSLSHLSAPANAGNNQQQQQQQHSSSQQLAPQTNSNNSGASINDASSTTDLQHKVN